MQPFEPFAFAALLADGVTTYLGLRAGADERNYFLRFFARLGGHRIPWAPGVVLLGLALYQHYFNYANFIDADHMRAGWGIVAAAHAIAALFNMKSIAAW